MSPRRLDDPDAFAIAQAIVEGFDRHWRLFGATCREAKGRFERADWAGQQQAQIDRIAFYDTRVDEAVARLRAEFRADELAEGAWQQVKLHTIGLLVGHLQPECAETFFNSVTTRILHRRYYRNEFLFVRPAVSTDYLENDEPAAQPTFRVYYPARATLPETLERVVTNFQFAREFEDLPRDVRAVLGVLLPDLDELRLRPNFQVQVLASPFYRNKAAYLVGKVINGDLMRPFALPVLHTAGGLLAIDTVLVGADDLEALFSFARAYFLVEMTVPSAVVQFLRTLMPRKARAELYAQVGLQKHGKALFYRDLLFHLRHSSDRFRVAPGIPGMVMLVFDLPSFPFVFKVIKDAFPPQKDTTREQVMAKYLLVKRHDRVGRMADTLEFSDVAFPRSRFGEDLLAALRRDCPSQLADDGESLVISHVYIERRMVPLNLHLQDATPEQRAHAVVEYGNAIKDLVAANIFPGDMLWKNFGVTRHGKVVFYDYDEIEILTDVRFRRVPEPRNEEEALSGEPWYPVGPHDVFPETFATFLLGNPAVRAIFLAHHAELLDAAFWQQHQARIMAGDVEDVFPYDPARRFRHGAPRPDPAVAPATVAA